MADYPEDTARQGGTDPVNATTGRKVRRAPQRLAAEQSPPVSQSSTRQQGGKASQTRGSEIARRKKMEDARRKQAEKDQIAAQNAAKAAKRETAQRVAQQMARRKAMQQGSTQIANGASSAAPRKRSHTPRTGSGVAQGSGNPNGQSEPLGETRARHAQGATARGSNAATTPKKGKRNGDAARPTQNGKRAGGAASQQRPTERKGGASGYKKDPNRVEMYDQDKVRTPAAEQPNKKQRKKMTKATIRRRKQIASVFAALLVVAMIVVGVVYSLDLLFKVTSIELQTTAGDTPADTGVYSEEIILAKIAIEIGDNFFSFRTAEQAALLQEAFPLLEDVQVVRDYPNTILVRFTPAVETYTMEIAGGWLVLSEQLHVMSTTATKPNLLVLTGATPSSYVAGQTLAFVQDTDTTLSATGAEQTLSAEELQAQSDAQLAALESLLGALEETELLQEITALAFEGENSISFLYQDRIVVLIGTTNSLTYKLQMVQYLLWNENGDGCSATDTGLLDVSYQGADGTLSTTFVQGEVVFPIGSESTQSDTQAGELDVTTKQAEDDTTETA